jgi:hypothetical protein
MDGPAAGVLTFVNIACCNWVQRTWGSWIHGDGANLEVMLEKRRRSRLLRHPIRWITRDSDAWVAIAAGLIGTVIVVTEMPRHAGQVRAESGRRG